MCTIYWDDNFISIDDKEVVNFIEKLNKTYLKIKPIIIQVEKNNGDTMCIGIGNHADYSVINYYSNDDGISKSVEGENEGSEVICFYMGDYESEFYIYETIQYKTALNILSTFVLQNILDKTVEWIDD